jgi:hypothetical protein
VSRVDWVEMVGYAGSALVVFSLTRTRLLQLRVVSLAGAVTFAVYGGLIESVPIVLTNAAILGINLWHVWKIATLSEDFSVLELPTDSPYLRRFLGFHAAEIGAVQPDFAGVDEGDTVIVVLRDMVPAALVVGHSDGDAFLVHLDFAIPAYRDFRMGRWLFEQRRDLFDRLGVSWIVATARTESHRRYLRRSGFERVSDERWQRRPG